MIQRSNRTHKLTLSLLHMKLTLNQSPPHWLLLLFHLSQTAKHNLWQTSYRFVAHEKHTANVLHMRNITDLLHMRNILQNVLYMRKTLQICCTWKMNSDLLNMRNTLDMLLLKNITHEKYTANELCMIHITDLLHIRNIIQICCRWETYYIFVTKHYRFVEYEKH